MFRNEDYLHDVTLVSDDHHQVSAHKLVLSACSEYFKNIFKHNSKLNAHPLLCLDGISSGDLNDIMDYIYNGEVQIFQENLDRFLNVAQRLKLEGLMENDAGFQNNFNETKIAKEEDETLPYETRNEINEPLKPRQVANAERVIVPVFSESAVDIEDTVNQHFERVSSGVYKCKLCGKIAKKSIDLKRHIETHIDGVSYECNVCAKTFRSKNSLGCHMTVFHK